MPNTAKMPEYMKAVGKIAITPLLTSSPTPSLTHSLTPTPDIKGGAGPISALYINPQTPRPTPGPTQALVKIKCFGLNRMDLLQREGRYPLPPQAGPILGVEFSGTIVSFGSQEHCLHFREGDAVFGLAYGGAYAEYIAVSTKMLLPKPAALSWEVAAGIPETWITATQALHFVGGFASNHHDEGEGKEEEEKEGGLTSLRGKSVLWHAGASGVSIAGIQLSLRAGAARAFATAGSDDKCAFVEAELGAARAINYRTTPDWEKEILALTDGKGVDLIVDFVGGAYAAKNLACAAREARIVQLGLMGGMKTGEAEGGLDIGPLLFKRVRWEGSTLRARDEGYQGRLRDKLEEYEGDFVGGRLKVFVDRVFRMEEIQEAHRLMEENVTRGKIICTVE